MGWGFRKSKSVGPFRFTLGKKGIGVSVGVKGARVGIGADGRARASMSIPGTGISYTATSSGAATPGAQHYSQNYGYRQPPTRSGMQTWLIALLVVGGVGGLLFGGCFCLAIMGSSHKTPTTVSKPSGPPPVDPMKVVKDACRKVESAGFVYGCTEPVRDGTRTTVDIAARDFLSDHVRITYDAPSGTAAASEKPASDPPPVDDYPNFKVTSATTRLTIEVTHENDAGTDEWSKCVVDHTKTASGTPDAKHKAAISACMKKEPLRYAWFHALYEHATKIVDGDDRNVACESGYLCGTGCTPHGDTCCIDVGHPDRNCSGGGLCTADNKCIGGTQPPSNGGGGGGFGGGCTCRDGSSGCCGRGCCSGHGGIAR